MLLKSYNEEESFSFGGLWQADYSIDSCPLPGKYILQDHIAGSDRYYALTQIDILGRSRNDIVFSIVVIDQQSRQVWKSKSRFKALTVLKVLENDVYYQEMFKGSESDQALSMTINHSNFDAYGYV